MEFVFDDKKAAQAAKYLIRKRGGRMDMAVMLKVMYLADRLSLIETGETITGDRMVSMENGTLLSASYDRVKEGFENPAWSGLRREGRWSIVLDEGTFDMGMLSQYDLDVLDRTFEEYGTLDFRALRGITHGLPEYEDPAEASPPANVLTVNPETILRSAGFLEEEIEDLDEQSEDLRFFKSLAG